MSMYGVDRKFKNKHPIRTAWHTEYICAKCSRKIRRGEFYKDYGRKKYHPDCVT